MFFQTGFIILHNSFKFWGCRLLRRNSDSSTASIVRDRRKFQTHVMSDPATKRPKMDAEIESGSGSGTQRTSSSPKEPSDRCTREFAEIVGTAQFVDKTLFIKAFLEEAASKMVILAPRGFGKSTNMNMVLQFVSGNEKLFKDNRLKIYEEERDFFDENCNPNPVIHVDFKRVGGQTWDAVLESLKRVVGRAYYDNRDLVTEDSKGNWTWANKKTEGAGITVENFMKYCENPENLSETDVSWGLLTLSQCLQLLHGKPVYVLIDTFDHPIMEAIMNKSKNEVVNDTIYLISRMMSILLKGNDYVKRALINACVDIPQALPNHIAHYEFLNEPSFAPYFGFTDQEVEDLFEKEEFKSRNNDEIQKWMHKKEYIIYSSSFILNYMEESRKVNKPAFNTYGVDSAPIKNLNKVFAETGFREDIENLINGEEIEIKAVDKIYKQYIFGLKSMIHEEPNIGYADLFLQFLSLIGYLNVVKCIGRNFTLKVPNEELKGALEQACYDADFFQTKYRLDGEKIVAYQNALCSLLERRDDNVFLSFAKAVSELFVGAEMPQKGDEFHCILLTFAYNLKNFEAHSELNTRKLKGKGRLDIVVVWHHMGLIMELKLKSETSVKAHEQIKTQEYDTAFNDPKYKDVTKKTLLGVHMAEDRTVSVTRSFDNESNTKTFTSNQQTTDI